VNFDGKLLATIQLRGLQSWIKVDSKACSPYALFNVSGELQVLTDTYNVIKIMNDVRMFKIYKGFLIVELESKQGTYSFIEMVPGWYNSDATKQSKYNISGTMFDFPSDYENLFTVKSGELYGIYDILTGNLLFNVMNGAKPISIKKRTLITQTVNGNNGTFKLYKIKTVGGSECTICMEISADRYAVVPCGHSSFCECIVQKNIKECPTCRGKVTTVIKLYQ
jgi:hypothetical protein